MDASGKSNILRNLQCEISLLSVPDGSASLEQGDTSVLASVYGPTQVKMNKEQIDKATVDVLYKAKTGLPSCTDKYTQEIIKRICEQAILSMLHPRTAINVTIQELQNNGSLLATCVNAVFLALLDASIPLHYTGAAVQCVLNQKGQIVLDPVKKEEEEDFQASFLFVFDQVDKNLIGSYITGTYSTDEYQACLAMCRNASQNVFDLYRSSMEKKIRKSIPC